MKKKHLNETNKVNKKSSLKRYKALNLALDEIDENHAKFLTIEDFYKKK